MKSAGLFLSLCCVFGNKNMSSEGGFERGIEWSRRRGSASSYGGEIARRMAAVGDAPHEIQVVLAARANEERTEKGLR